MNSRGNVGSAVAITKASAPLAAGDKILVTTLHFILKDENL